jgi:regulatory protein
VSAKAKALALLSRREHSEYELTTKLNGLGYAEDEIAGVVQWLQSKDWQSNARFAESLSRRRAVNYGSRYIRAELQQHAVDEHAIADALAALGSEAERALKWLHKKYDGRSPTPEQKMLGALIQRGFELQASRQALKSYRQHDTSPLSKT